MPHHRTCTSATERGIEDPEGRCDPELEVVRPLGKVYSRPFDPVALLNREARGFLVLNGIELEPLAHKGNRAPKEGASIVELSSTGAPLRQCFATSSGFSGGATGIRDGALDSQGRLALTGWVWGSGLSFGGESISAPARYRSSYLAVLTERAKHAFSTALGGPSWNDANSVAFDSSGNLVVAGSYFQRLDLGAAKLPAHESPALYVVKYDARGQLLWAHVSPHGVQHVQPAVTFTDTGTVLVVGGYSQYLDFGTPLPKATPLELPQCTGNEQRAPGVRRMFWVELDASGRELRAQSFGEPHAEAFDVASSPEGDVIVTGAFRGRLSLGGPPLRAPASPGSCGCDIDCAYPLARFVARFDRQRQMMFQDALRDSIIVRSGPGPARSTIVEQGIPVSFTKRWGQKLPDDYRWHLAIRSQAGVPQWSRTFDKLDLKSTAPSGAGRLALLVHDPETSTLFLMIYRPAIWSAAPIKKLGMQGTRRHARHT